MWAVFLILVAAVGCASAGGQGEGADGAVGSIDAAASIDARPPACWTIERFDEGVGPGQLGNGIDLHATGGVVDVAYYFNLGSRRTARRGLDGTWQLIAT